MINQLKPLMGKLCSFAKDRMGFKHPPKLFLKSDAENSQMALGRTAHYDPDKECITLYITNRHPKDILRSLAHELVHHTQNLRGDLAPEKMGDMSKNYAQDNDHMRNMEKEAYLQGNMCFRDWEDGLDNKELFIIKLAESNFLKQANKEKKPVNIKELKETIRQVVEAATEKKEGGKDSSFPDYSGDKKITQKDILMAKGVIPKPDEEAQGSKPKPGEKAKGSKESESKAKKPKEKKSNTKKENKSMTTKITKEFLEETIRDLLQKQISEQEKIKGTQAGKDLAKSLMNNDQEALAAADDGSKMIQYRGELRSVASLKAEIETIRRLNRKRMDTIEALKLNSGSEFNVDKQPYQNLTFPNEQEQAKYIGDLEKLVKRKEEDAKRIERTIARGGQDPKKAAAIANKGILGVMNKLAADEKEDDPLDAYQKADSKGKGQKGLPEASVGTPEKENALYEQRFTAKNTRLYEKLVKEWTK